MKDFTVARAAEVILDQLYSVTDGRVWVLTHDKVMGNPLDYHRLMATTQNGYSGVMLMQPVTDEARKSHSVTSLGEFLPLTTDTDIQKLFKRVGEVLRAEEAAEDEAHAAANKRMAELERKLQMLKDAAPKEELLKQLETLKAAYAETESQLKSSYEEKLGQAWSEVRSNADGLAGQQRANASLQQELTQMELKASRQNDLREDAEHKLRLAQQREEAAEQKLDMYQRQDAETMTDAKKWRAFCELGFFGKLAMVFRGMRKG